MITTNNWGVIIGYAVRDSHATMVVGDLTKVRARNLHRRVEALINDGQDNPLRFESDGRIYTIYRKQAIYSVSTEQHSIF